MLIVFQQSQPVSSIKINASALYSETSVMNCVVNLEGLPTASFLQRLGTPISSQNLLLYKVI